MPRALTVFMVLLALTVTGLPLYPATGHAEDSGIEVEHGKINTPDPSPVDPGNGEFEISYSNSFAGKQWDDNGDPRSRGFTREQAVGFSMTLGVIDNLDIAISSGHDWIKDKENDYDEDDGVTGPQTGHGFEDLNFNGRYRFFEDKERAIEIAYIGGLTTPVGKRSTLREIGCSQNYWSFDQTIVGAKDWGPWTANADIGYSLPFGDQRENARGALNTDIAVGYQALSWLQPEAEVNYAHEFVAFGGDRDVLAFTAGLVMPVHERLRINTGVQQGAMGRNADRATTLFIAAKTAF